MVSPASGHTDMACFCPGTQLRETKKREDKLNDCVRRFREAKDRAEQESKATKDLLKVARSQLRAFRLTHPDWRPPPDIEPTTADEDTDCRHIFNTVDKDLDVEAQMKLDPSGVCLTMCVHMCVVYMGCVCVCVCVWWCVCVYNHISPPIMTTGHSLATLRWGKF